MFIDFLSVLKMLLLESHGIFYACILASFDIQVSYTNCAILQVFTILAKVMIHDFYLNTLWQVEEETGICLKKEDMVDLTAFLDQSTGCRMFPSPVSWS